MFTGKVPTFYWETYVRYQNFNASLNDALSIGETSLVGFSLYSLIMSMVCERKIKRRKIFTKKTSILDVKYKTLTIATG